MVGSLGVVQSLSHLAAKDLPGILPNDLVGSFAVVRDPVARIASEYRFQSGTSRASKLSFSTWLRVALKAAKKDPRVYENHIRPQVELIPQGAAIFRLEDGFADMVEWIDKVTGSRADHLEVGHFLKRERKSIDMSREDLELIHDYYAKDFARLGYERHDVASSPSDKLAVFRNLAAAPIGRVVVAQHHRRWMHRPKQADQTKRSANPAK